MLPISSALADVLCQPFPTFPLLGPRQVSEIRSSFQGLDSTLTPEDLHWPNREEDCLFSGKTAHARILLFQAT